MTDQPQTNLTTTANAAANLPATKAGEGLTYATATPEERAVMDQVITTVTDAIKNGKPKAIIEISGSQLQSLAEHSDKMLQNINPQATLSFREALGQLMDALKTHSMLEIRKSMKGGAMSQLGHSFSHLLHHEPTNKELQEQVNSFMTQIDSSRKSISEMVDRLVTQEDELNKDYDRIDEMGEELSKAAQLTQIKRAGTAEAIRRIKAGEITVMTDIEKKATSGRAEDLAALQLAQANWSNLGKVDGALLTAVNVFNANLVQLALAKTMDLQNTMQTQNALGLTVPMWKSQLMTAGFMMRQENAAEMLKVLDQMVVQGIKQAGEDFTKATDLLVDGAGAGTAAMVQLIQTENGMTATMQGLGARLDEKYNAQEAAKKGLETASQGFKKASVVAFTQPGGITGAKIDRPQPGSPA